MANVSYLLDIGADVNLVYDNEKTVLHYAAISPDNNILLKLLKKSSNIDVRDRNSLTPLMLAVQQGKFNNTKIKSRINFTIDFLSQDKKPTPNYLYQKEQI